MLGNTTIVHIIKEYIPLFKEEIRFISFRYSDNAISTGCFRGYHSGNTIELESGNNLLVNFITKKPQLPVLLSYKYNNIKSYDVSPNLIMVGDYNWKIKTPTYTTRNDIRQYYHNENIFRKNNILHLTLNNNFTNFDSKSKNCLVNSTGNELSEQDIIYRF